VATAIIDFTYERYEFSSPAFLRLIARRRVADSKRQEDGRSESVRAREDRRESNKDNLELYNKCGCDVETGLGRCAFSVACTNRHVEGFETLLFLDFEKNAIDVIK